MKFVKNSVAFIFFINISIVISQLFDGALDALQGFQNGVNSLFKSLTYENMKETLKSEEFLAKFIDSTVDEDCFYKCPIHSRDEPYPNPHYKPTADGCGSLGIFLKEKDLPQSGMVDCCNSHDLCYGKCLSDKEKCDKEFKKCLYATCKSQDSNKIKLKMCQGGAKILHTAVLAFGCTSFLESQSEACLCRPKTKSEL